MTATATLHNGDCVAYMAGMPDKSVDLLLTDIPYGEVNRDSNGLRNLDKGGADTVCFDLRAVAESFVRLTRGSIYVFCGTEQVSLLRSVFVKHGLSTRLLVWEKTNPSPMNGEHLWLSSIECCVFGKFSGAPFNGHCESAVLRYPVASGQEHPTQKPLDLFKRLVSTSSDLGQTVFDPFMGSGTSGVAALYWDRNFIGCEIDPRFFKIAERRIRDEEAQGKLFTADVW